MDKQAASSGQWIAGRIPVLECLRARKRAARKLYLLENGKGLEPIRAEAGLVPIEACSRSELDRLLPNFTHQGAILEAEPLPVHALENWAARPFPADCIVMALNEIEDPHNFGAIVRSAAAAGARGVVFGKHRAAPISSASLKSAAGAMEHIDLVETANLVRGLRLLKDAGFWLAALDAEAPQVNWEVDITGRIVLVVGSEGRGLRRLAREVCDFHLRIPIQGPISSLNASVSAGIALAECLRQRYCSQPPRTGRTKNTSG